MGVECEADADTGGQPPPLPCSQIVFTNEGVSNTQIMPLPKRKAMLSEYTRTCAHCLANLHKCPGVAIACTATEGAQVVTLKVPENLISHLPLLQDIRRASGKEAGHVASHEERSNESEAPPVPVGGEETVNFEPPSSVWALTSVLLMIHGDMNLWLLFGTAGTGPWLASESLLVRIHLHVHNGKPSAAIAQQQSISFPACTANSIRIPACVLARSPGCFWPL